MTETAFAVRQFGVVVLNERTGLIGAARFAALHLASRIAHGDVSLITGQRSR